RPHPRRFDRGRGQGRRQGARRDRAPGGRAPAAVRAAVRPALGRRDDGHGPRRRPRRSQRRVPARARDRPRRPARHPRARRRHRRRRRPGGDRRRAARSGFARARVGARHAAEGPPRRQRRSRLLPGARRFARHRADAHQRQRLPRDPDRSFLGPPIPAASAGSTSRPTRPCARLGANKGPQETTMSALPESVRGAAANDADPTETREWLDALAAVIASEGGERAHFLLEQLIDEARQSGIDVPFSANTAYVNTIPTDQEERSPGNIEIEGRLRAYMRWNAMAMVVKANRLHPADGGDLGGHISSFASLATMFGTGFNHFWHAESADHGGDLLYIQGHSSPGVYARAFMEGRLSEEQLLNFRQEVDGKGISSYPHPKLMPEFWQFPTVSMGLGPLMAIYQARFLKYLYASGMANTENRKVWVFCGDGEMDEPESLGAIGLAAREKLDNLIFVVNCNLQRLDGPVRGNGKIIQELESEFRGSGWNVIKLLWGGYWDPLLARDKEHVLRKIME